MSTEGIISKYTATKADYEDLTSCFDLIRLLAEYEKAADEVSLTLSEFQEDYKNGKFEILLCRDLCKAVIGMALFYPIYSTWKGTCIYLEDIIVSPEYRRKGVGTAIFDELIQYCKTSGVKRLKWQVLDWNQLGIDFYAKYAAIHEQEWLSFKLNYDQIQSF